MASDPVETPANCPENDYGWKEQKGKDSFTHALHHTGRLPYLFAVKSLMKLRYTFMLSVAFWQTEVVGSEAIA